MRKIRVATFLTVLSAAGVFVFNAAYGASEFPGLVFSKVTSNNQLSAASSGTLPTDCGVSQGQWGSAALTCNGGLVMVCLFNQSNQPLWLTMGFSEYTGEFTPGNQQSLGLVPAHDTFGGIVCSGYGATEFYMGGIAGHEFAFSTHDLSVDNNAHAVSFTTLFQGGSNGTATLMKEYDSHQLPGYANTTIAPGQPACQTPSDTIFHGVGTTHNAGNVCYYGLVWSQTMHGVIPNFNNSAGTIYMYVYPTIDNAGEGNNNGS